MNTRVDTDPFGRVTRGARYTKSKTEYFAGLRPESKAKEKSLMPKSEQDTVTNLQKEVAKLQSENSKIKQETARLKDKISKQEIQLERAALKFEKQEMTFAKQKNKLEQKILELNGENKRLKDPQIFSPVDLSKYK
jgi:predicted  nucleic acid-binding Zn-ribbon protein